MPWLDRVLVPTKVTGGGIDAAVVVQVAAGYDQSMALTAAGELWTWGGSQCGQLGHGNKEHLTVPRVVDGTGVVVGIAGGECRSFVITAEGRVLAFGCNGEIEYSDANGDELDEPYFVVDGRLGLGAEAQEALTPTAIDGVTMGEGEGEEGAGGKEEKE
jgi:alpha-tubulin suppressor-like RCC1 family protein